MCGNGFGVLRRESIKIAREFYGARTISIVELLVERNLVLRRF